MQDTPTPETFEQTLGRMGIAAALETFIDPALVRRWGLMHVEAFCREHGYRFEREHGNIYGKLRLIPLEPAAPALILRVITRSDHAAVYGSKPRAA